MSNRNALQTSRNEDFSEWYQEVIIAAELAENSMVRGCMIIKPWGYAIWERIKELLDSELKKSDHENCYFPMFIPLELFEKEAEHVSGFAKEMAVVTHHRLEANETGKLVPAGKLESPLIVRPTSETIIGESFAKWIKSYRDLPLKINQWTNVVRWEMRPRIFLRTSEFLWQEGHTAHSSCDEALEETKFILSLYGKLAENYMRIPVYKGVKSESEKFPGAAETYCIEAIMQDGKALQAGTSHYLSQNFSKAAEIKFQTDKGDLDYAYTTSWGCSTRLIGALIMTHSDDDGLRLPSEIAPYQIVIIPVIKKDSSKDEITKYCSDIKNKLNDSGIRCTIVKHGESRGEKWRWIKKGVPLILEIGEKELKTGKHNFIRRIDINKKYESQMINLISDSRRLLVENDNVLWEQANGYLKTLCNQSINRKDDFIEFLTNNTNKHAIVAWNENEESHYNEIISSFGYTIRCKLEIESNEDLCCVLTNRKATHKIVVAKSY
ncbi:proline--tRNA ligase [Enterobacter roggenkampii]|uniref:proline--tRNA ligase n=1 Tax=Enterobacter roggenkampii TaxID=1812935 RepID=UPI0008DD0F7B|nr:proline--tRNA ligase [Enterobacter roggenkampii]OHY53822.1 proline--tRNA ligase [Enterobacter roggenkampii]OHY63420.1 proline--tRNA ligase [Enterobacter roggenkampii]